MVGRLSGGRNVSGRAVSIALLTLLASALSLAAQQPLSSAECQRADGSAEVNAADEAVFDERAAAQVLGTIRNGLESHSQRRLLSAFDADKMDGFLTFEDQIEAYFGRYEGFRVVIRIIQTSEENHRGVILAEFQLENESRGGYISRREGQLRFELERVPRGWKIVDFNPRDFFS
jgi:hypothetical protein